jgi:hypothetical protein
LAQVFGTYKGWIEIAPPSALMRSRLGWVTVSAWSKNQRLLPGKPRSAAIRSKTLR